MILMGKTRQAENITYKLLPNRKSSSIQCKQSQTLNAENAVEKNWLFYYEWRLPGEWEAHSQKAQLLDSLQTKCYREKSRVITSKGFGSWVFLIGRE